MHSTTARIAIALLLVQLSSVTAVLLVILNVTNASLYAQSRDYSQELQIDLQDSYREGGVAELTEAINRRLTTAKTHDVIIALRQSDGKMIAGNLQKWPQSASQAKGWHIIKLPAALDSPAIDSGIMIANLKNGSQLLAGEKLVAEQRLFNAGRNAFLLASLLGIALALIGSLALARYIGRKVNRVTSVASEVASGHLTHRIALDGSQDAFDRLSLAINEMLSRIEILVGELRLVTDSLAHDLRSPVARIKASIERALAMTQDRTAQAALGSVNEETDLLNNMLSNALQISRAEAGLGKDQFKNFNVTLLLHDLAEVYGPLVEENGCNIICTTDAPIMITAHRELLGQAVSNLIDNALKHAINSDAIILSAEQREDILRLSVSDNGQGIAENRRDEALKRFGRLDAARNSSGAGLGLSLVSTIAHLHGGTFNLEDNAPGLRAIMAMPVIMSV